MAITSLFRRSSSDCYHADNNNRYNDEDVKAGLSFGSLDFKSYDCDDQSLTSATDDCSSCHSSSSSSSSTTSEYGLHLVTARSTCNFGSTEDESSSTKSFNSKSFRRRRRIKFKGTTERKTVSFSGFDEMYEIDPIEDDLEIDNYYGSEEELMASKDRCRMIVKAVNDGRIGNGTNHKVCIRGIEKYTSLGSYKRKYLRRQLYDLVNEIQEMQESFGQDLSMKMAQLCEKISSNSVVDALEYAEEDELFVQQSLQ